MNIFQRIKLLFLRKPPPKVEESERQKEPETVSVGLPIHFSARVEPMRGKRRRPAKYKGKKQKREGNV